MSAVPNRERLNASPSSSSTMSQLYSLSAVLAAVVLCLSLACSTVGAVTANDGSTAPATCTALTKFLSGNPEATNADIEAYLYFSINIQKFYGGSFSAPLINTSQGDDGVASLTSALRAFGMNITAAAVNQSVTDAKIAMDGDSSVKTNLHHLARAANSFPDVHATFHKEVEENFIETTLAAGKLPIMHFQAWAPSAVNMYAAAFDHDLEDIAAAHTNPNAGILERTSPSLLKSFIARGGVPPNAAHLSDAASKKYLNEINSPHFSLVVGRNASHTIFMDPHFVTDDGGGAYGAVESPLLYYTRWKTWEPLTDSSSKKKKKYNGKNFNAAALKAGADASDSDICSRCSIVISINQTSTFLSALEHSNDLPLAYPLL